MNVLLPMRDADLNAKLLMQMLGKVLGRVYTAVLAACTTETENQMGKATLYVAGNMAISKCINTIEEGEYLSIILKETYHGFIKTCEFLVRLIAAWIVSGTAVEDIASTIARRIFRYAFFI